MIRTGFVCMLFYFATSSAQLLATKGTVCRNDTDCAVGQCCFIEPEFLVVSRRQAMLPGTSSLHHTKHDTGVCENYHQLGDACYPLETMNNHCGCLTGLSCSFVPATTIPPVPILATKTRRKIYYPGPGSYRCVKH